MVTLVWLLLYRIRPRGRGTHQYPTDSCLHCPSLVPFTPGACLTSSSLDAPVEIVKAGHGWTHMRLTWTLRSSPGIVCRLRQLISNHTRKQFAKNLVTFHRNDFRTLMSSTASDDAYPREFIWTKPGWLDVDECWNFGSFRPVVSL
jgi:hypothetical protein